MNVSKIYNSIPTKLEETSTKDKIPLKQNMNIERMNNDVLETFKKIHILNLCQVFKFISFNL